MALTERPTPSLPLKISIPGKVFAIGFGALTLVLLLLMLGVAFRFQAIMSQMDRVRDAWPPAVETLNARNALVLEHLRTGDAKGLEEFEQLLASSRQSSLFEDQSPYMYQLEKIVQDKANEVQGVVPISEVDQISSLQVLEKQRREMQSDWLGATCVFLLRLKLPPYFIFD